VRLGKLTNVNRLSPSNGIVFGPAPGLTVVYGDNGSGKSGYARVIKKACRARGGSAPIEPNVFKNLALTNASAEFTLSVDGKEFTVGWQDGLASDENLTRILFFDAVCAENYVQEDGGTTFSPAGLDVFAKLTKVCDSVRDRIALRSRTTRESIEATRKTWSLHEGTKVATFVNNLSALSDETKIDSLSQWEEKAAQRLLRVRVLLSSDPQQRAAATRAGSARIGEFRVKLCAQIEALSDLELQKLQECREELLAAEAAQVIASQSAFDGSFLKGTGGGAWRILWEAARAYSTLDAYPEKPFPYVGTGAVCVLCQTSLDDVSSERLSRFESFVKTAALNLTGQKRHELEGYKARLEGLPDLTDAYAAVTTDLLDLDESAKFAIRESIAECKTRRDYLLRLVYAGDCPVIAKAPANPIHYLAKLEESKEAQAASEAALHDPDARATLQREANELEDRQWLMSNGPAVLEQIQRLKKLARLEATQADTNTAQITSKSTGLSKALVTDALCNAFKIEIEALGLKTIEVALVPVRGQKATLRFGVRLAGVDRNVVGKVASEGEKRCMAFALFLAELSQASDSSALVLDDPVSSLDHLHGEKMAERIAREALKRQVIVFTHNPVFLHDLQAGAEASNATLQLGYLQWNGDTPGEWNAGLPWDWKGAKDRIDYLKKEQQLLAKTVGRQMTEADRQGLRGVYSLLRGTLERFIETKIFGGAVVRFRSYINVKLVEGAVGFDQAEFDELKRLFDCCSDITEAHDASSGLHKNLPSPQELKADIEDTEKLIEIITNRQKANKKGGNP
jgi:energy-coupling factor transporter ATP-binding protein EcfA2